VDEVVEADVVDVVVLLATVVVVDDLPLATVVVVVATEVVGALVVDGAGAPAAIPDGSSSRNVDTAPRSAAGGCGTASPFGRKAIVMSSPLANRMPFALEAGTTVPFVDVGLGQVSTEI
jgi:hypothetical protein